jgi:hypothetical protein
LTGQLIQILLAIEIFFCFDPDFLCIPLLGQSYGRQLYDDEGSHIQIMNASSQAQGGCIGCAGGVPNNKNDILINIVKRMLPQGLEAWRQIAAEYQREPGETTLCRGEDLQENWNKKLCNCMQKPTGKPGALQDHIFRCIDIERCIQAEANPLFWVWIWQSPATLAMTAQATTLMSLKRKALVPMMLLMLSKTAPPLLVLSSMMAEVTRRVRRMKRWRQRTSL